MTRRDHQNEAKKMGRPWTTAKSFDQSAPCSRIAPASMIRPNKGAIRLELNGKVVQNGNISALIWNVPARAGGAFQAV